MGAQRLLRKRASVSVIAALAIACAACSPSAAGHSAASEPPLVSLSHHAPLPGCRTTTAAAPRLSRVHTALRRVGPSPFGVVVTPAGKWAFVAQVTSIAVLRTGDPPVLVHTIPLPRSEGGALGDALTSDGRYLLAASGSGALVISVSRAEQGQPHPVLGTLSAPGGAGGAIEVAVSPGNQFAFVSLEDAQSAAVFNLGRALADGFGPADYVGRIPLGVAPVGLAISPDGRWLYATSEVDLAARRQAPARSTTRSHLSQPPGTLTVINLSRAQTHPAASVVATVTAGCGPVRVITAGGGSEVWVTARESDTLLCFSAAALRSNPARALVAAVQVGEAPVGLALVSHGTRIVVADSNRFGQRGASANLAVVSVPAALAGRPAVLGYIPSGLFPRQLAVSPVGTTLYATNFDSGQIESVNVGPLP
jgi:DNA-binding beta-propeller fold protein YncE